MNLIELRPVLVGHPVVDLDLAAGLHVLEEVLLASTAALLPNDR